MLPPDEQCRGHQYPNCFELYFTHTQMLSERVSVNILLIFHIVDCLFTVFDYFSTSTFSCIVTPVFIHSVIMCLVLTCVYIVLVGDQPLVLRKS